MIQGEAAVIHKEVGSGLVLTLIWVDGPCAYIVRSITCDGSKYPVEFVARLGIVRVRKDCEVNGK